MSDLVEGTGADRVDMPFAGAIRLVLEMDETEFQNVREALNGSTFPGSPSRLARAVAERADVARNDARAIVSAVTAMLAAGTESSPDAEFNQRELALTVTRHQLAELTAGEAETAADRLVLLMRSEGLRLLAKARRLNYAHDRVYQSGEVLSDLRPIFGGGEGFDPSGFLIWHTLRVRYSTGANPDDERKIIEFALDGRDLELLRAQIDRAIEKHKALKSKLREFSTVHVPMGDLKEADDD